LLTFSFLEETEGDKRLGFYGEDFLLFVYFIQFYHLYEDLDGGYSLSIIGPTEWKKKYVYSVVLNSDMTWTKID
jgi:hypothetical protein